MNIQETEVENSGVFDCTVCHILVQADKISAATKQEDRQ